MTITPQNIITAGAVLAALLAIFGYYNKGYKRYLKMLEQEKDLKEIVAESVKKGNLSFTTSMARGVEESNVIFITRTYANYNNLSHTCVRRYENFD